VLITGGAGFIGSHLADELLAEGCAVRVLDNLSEQVHGSTAERPDYLSSEVELIKGDVRDAEAIRRALKKVDAVVHLAAMVGVGQSMYQVADYTMVNNQGTANLLQALIEKPVEKLAPGNNRSLQQLKARNWEVYDAQGQVLAPVPTPESKAPNLASVYALSKFDQEQLCLIVGGAYNIPTVALRFFNVYGTRQALSNPYTGVMAIFAARLLNGNAPLIFEDGLQRRAFVSVRDVARGCRLALERDEARGCAINIGSGQQYTIRELAARIAAAMGKGHLEPEIAGKYRVGDVRHCFADISLARRLLGYEPRIAFEEGLGELVEWLEGQVAVDRVDQASAELSARGLTV
jgi:dTDP-L-rhamnose 4-epimerase